MRTTDHPTIRLKPSIRLPTSCLAALAAALVQANAVTSLEDFNYAAGSDVAAQAGGVGWAIPWATKAGDGTIVTESGSLTYPGIVSTGEKMHCTGISGTGKTTTTYRDLESALTNGTHYIRYLAQNLNEGRRYFGLGLFNNTSERALLGQGSTYESWTLNHVIFTNASYTNILVSPVDSSAIALLVLKLELLDGPERVTFWVNPDLSKPEDVSTAVGGVPYLTDYDYGKISRLRIGSGGYSATAGGDPTEHYMDEISVSPVTPFAPPSITCVSESGTAALSWPAAYLGWTLQAQTNALGIDASGAWDDVPDTSQVTSTTVALDSANPTVFFRLRSP